MTTRIQSRGQIQRPGQKPQDTKLIFPQTLSTGPIAYQENTIYEDVTIPENRNAMSMGPTVTIYTGFRVQVLSGAVWTIL